MAGTFWAGSKKSACFSQYYAADHAGKKMMDYLWLKYIHVLSSTVLFGTGLGTAAVMLYGHIWKDIKDRSVLNDYVVFVDWIFTGASGVLQFITGLWMVFLAGYPLRSLWIAGSLVLYFLAAACWFPVVWIQIKIARMTRAAAETESSLPAEYSRLFRLWLILGFIAFSSLLIVFYLMVTKPF